MVVTGPIARLVWDLADRDASRWAVPFGASGVAGDAHHDDQFTAWKDGTLNPVGSPPTVTLRPVSPVADAPLLHAWFTEPRAAFWGMASRSVEEVADIYGWIDDQDHLAASLVHLDAHPVGLLQTYDPFVDEIGEHYDRRPGDLGVHLFLADDPARAGRTPMLVEHLVGHVLADPAVQRVVLEPDVPTPSPSPCWRGWAPSSARWRRSRRRCPTCPPRPPSSPSSPGRGPDGLRQARASVASSTKAGSSSRSP